MHYYFICSGIYFLVTPEWIALRFFIDTRRALALSECQNDDMVIVGRWKGG